MQTPTCPRLLTLALFLTGLALSGCGGTATLPDAVLSQQVQGPAVRGSVFGGHAPIVGAHVYVVQPSTAGYGQPGTSLLGNNGTTSAGGYALTADTSDPFVPVGAMYETTDSTGSFNLTGGYTCTANQPVYLYSYGGNATSSTVTTTSKNNTVQVTASITQIVVTNAVANSGTGTATYAITLGSNEQFSANASVSIAGLTGNLSIINGTQTVIGSPAPTSNTFSITATDVYGSYQSGNSASSTKYETVADGTYTATSGPGGNAPTGGGSAGTGAFGSNGTATGTPTTVSATNPNVQLATLGICPAAGNFYTAGAGALQYVYMNEVSTVATAYTFQPFTIASNNNAWDIGSSGTTQALLGIKNAALTAAQLYDIQGSLVDSGSDGEGHIANTATQSATGTPNAGNGVVPQAAIDTLANVLAACIDSSPGTGGTLSTQCTTLFNTATVNGSTYASGDTAATDVAAAAINIARYPAGNRSGTPDPTYAADIYGVASGTVPYAPNLSTAPNDWTFAITYTGGGIGPTAGQSPLSVAVDAVGNIYTTNSSANKLVIFNPFGIPSNSTGYGSSLSLPASVAVDNSSANVWVTNYGSDNVSRFTTTGASETEFPLPLSTNAGLQAAALDGAGNVWVTTSGNGNSGPSSLTELDSLGVIQQTYTANMKTPYGLAIDKGPTGAIWLADFGQSYITGCAQTQATGGCTAYTTGGVNSAVGVAIDAADNSWFTNKGGTVSAVNVYGAGLANSPYTTGSTNYTDGIAFDGGNNMWVTDSASSTVFELNGSGVAITPTAGYLANPATSPDGIAVDPSGNVWYNSSSAGTLYELVGAAQPVVTPISYAVQLKKIAQKP